MAYHADYRLTPKFNYLDVEAFTQVVQHYVLLTIHIERMPNPDSC